MSSPIRQCTSTHGVKQNVNYYKREHSAIASWSSSEAYGGALVHEVLGVHGKFSFIVQDHFSSNI